MFNFNMTDCKCHIVMDVVMLTANYKKADEFYCEDSENWTTKQYISIVSILFSIYTGPNMGNIINTWQGLETNKILCLSSIYNH